MFSHKYKTVNPFELQEKIDQLPAVYKPANLDPAFHTNKLMAVKKLDYILKRTNRNALQCSNFEELLLCSLTLVYYFGMRLKLSRLTSKFWYWCGKKQFKKAEADFQNTMNLLLPESCDVTIKVTLGFFTHVSLWPFQSFVGKILEVVLYYNRGKTTLFNFMLTDIHCVLFSDVKSARHRMRVLYELLKSSNWVIDKMKLLPFVTRLLDFFAYSIDKGDRKIMAYRYLNKGFEVCLRRIFERVENQHRLMIITTMLNWFSMVNMNDEEVLEFASLLEYAASVYIVKTYSESFDQGLIDHVLTTLVGSPNSTYSLVGCRLLLRFLDRHHNGQYLTVPTVYYKFTEVNLKKGPYSLCDKSFLRHIREQLHKHLMQVVRDHGFHSFNMKSVLSVISCIVLEVPCGLTAAAGACLAMSIQDYALNDENLSTPCRYWMHAVVISVMSLICWVHKAPLLYTYVNQIIGRRAKEAPQLNPPMKYYYQISRNHVTWNKPSLFFEDWELRYALWKHFQDTQQKTGFNIGTKLSRKAPSMDLIN